MPYSVQMIALCGSPDPVLPGSPHQIAEPLAWAASESAGQLDGWTALGLDSDSGQPAASVGAALVAADTVWLGNGCKKLAT